MRVELKPHPHTPCTAITAIEVETWRTESGGLVVRYHATGKIAELKLPEHADWSRADRLWEHTCFEAFVRTAHGAAYYELNFSPSSQWAAYHFNNYRQGLRVADEINPQVEMARNSDQYELRAYVKREQLAALPQVGFWRLALSAVIEETSGGKSYWALAHPAGKPDFHHADGFALELP